MNVGERDGETDKERERDRETDKQTETQRQRDRQRDRETQRERQTDRQTDRQTQRDTKRQRERHRETDSGFREDERYMFYMACGYGSNPPHHQMALLPSPTMPSMSSLMPSMGAHSEAWP